MSFRRLRPASLGLAAALLLASAALADYRESYRKGVVAADRRNWPEVARQMRDALREQPSEGGPKVLIYGSRIEAYLPHFYLGWALYEMNDMEGALERWQTSEAHGVVQGTDKYRTLQRLRSAAAKQAKPKPPPPEPTPAPEKAEAAAEALARAREGAESEVASARKAREEMARARQDPALQAAWERDPTLAQQERQALGYLTAAEAQMEKARTAAEANQARETAIKARQELQVTLLALREVAARAKAEPPRPTPAPAVPAVTEVVPAAEAPTADLRRQGLERDLARLQRSSAQLLMQATQRSAQDPLVARQRTELEGLLDQARKVRADSPPEQLEGVRDRLARAASALRESLSRPLETVAGKPPAPLVAAARAYFQSDYEQALKVLQSARFADRPARVQLHLFRAASQFALYRRDGERDRALLDQTRVEIRSCLALMPGFSPSARFFSPRFRQLFLDVARERR